jgi:hypothetical protein
MLLLVQGRVLLLLQRAQAPMQHVGCFLIKAVVPP